MDSLIDSFDNIKVSMGCEEFEYLCTLYMRICSSRDHSELFKEVSNKVSFYFREIGLNSYDYEEDYREIIEQIKQLFVQFLSTPDSQVTQKMQIAERLFSRMIFFVKKYNGEEEEMI